ncbi:MAG: phage holin family protein [Oscillospiraceae bacterium]|nr:phage holin family protein [Oscillospiraceae bacterium]
MEIFETLGMASVVAITVIALLIGKGVKLIPFVKDEWIPVICGFVGALLGVPAMHVMPDYPATDIITAIAVGAVSGFAATGMHQVYKQLYPSEDDVDAETTHSTVTVPEDPSDDSYEW